TPLLRPMANGFYVLDRDGATIYLAGAGASPGGDRPFLDRFDLKTLHAERLFRCDPDAYEFFAGWEGPGRSRLLTRRESPKDPPNYYVRAIGAPRAAAAGEAAWTSVPKPVTRFADPTPELRGITKRLVTYKRADGTPLSFTLYLPPGYKPGTKLPTVLWAYPLEYSDEGTAGQVSGSDRRFLTITGASPLFFTLDGYAVLDNVAMPVIGHPDSVYNDYLDQIVSNAKAAIDKAVALGVTDPDRVGVAGHSHGAFMTANLLAHSDLFRAGIARSGAYNHTLRPFGFQTERRSYFEAPESYLRLSPELHADQIREPILIIHGEDDANPGTVPLQSDLLYRAVVGTGGTARLVMLPLESHSYEAKESIEHTLWEMMNWFDRYVKDAPARDRAAGAESARPNGSSR
ncbi:MAG: alpha/beta hydrolase family protein, partial [Bacteroidota bacterium]